MNRGARMAAGMMALVTMIGFNMAKGKSRADAAALQNTKTAPPAAGTTDAETQTPPVPGKDASPAAKPAPERPPAVRPVEVQRDRRVTFRIYAPHSSEARVDCAGRHEMTKDSDGVWSVTIGPLVPDVYSYSFTLDDTVHVPDARNNFKKNPGEDLLEIPANPPAPWQQLDVPHGSIHVDWYPSRSLGITRRVHVYTPPGYEQHPRTRYPVLYLLHGSGDDDSNWTNIGCANKILDNLIAEDRALPMIVVMPMGHVPGLPGEPDRGSAPARIARFQADLLDDLVPYVERAYRVHKDVDHRGIAGLSMGAIQSQIIALQHPGRFAWVGLMSGAGLRTENLDSAFAELAANPEKANREFRLIYISIGTSDRLLPPSQKVDAWLTQHGIRHTYHEMEGGHEWKVWRHSLAAMVPLLFR